MLKAVTHELRFQIRAAPNCQNSKPPHLRATACITSTTLPGFRTLRAERNRTRVWPSIRLLQRRIGTTRDVVVTPAPYVTDNRVTLDAIAQFGKNARGVAVVHPTVTNAELKNAAGSV